MTLTQTRLDLSDITDQARCNDGTGNLVALFFSEMLDDIARAKTLCNECPVREACFEAALVRREPYGVWGGQLFFKGRVLASKRPRGRPPKKGNVIPLGKTPTDLGLPPISQLAEACG